MTKITYLVTVYNEIKTVEKAIKDAGIKSSEERELKELYRDTYSDCKGK